VKNNNNISISRKEICLEFGIREKIIPTCTFKIWRRAARTIGISKTNPRKKKKVAKLFKDLNIGQFEVLIEFLDRWCQIHSEDLPLLIQE
jgi:hypothetical protein